MTWRDQAACLGEDPEMFSTEGKGHIPIAGIRICQGCPVRRDCLTYAVVELDALSDDLVWGGTTVRTRALVRNGTLTLDEAMARGDRLAEGRTDVERIVEDEPWLQVVDAVPVPIRRPAGRTA